MNLYESKKLREERASLIEEMNGLTVKAKQEDRSFTGEELERYDRLDQAQKDLDQRIKTVERIEGAEQLRVALPATEQRKVTNAITTQRDADNAIKAWALSASGFDHMVTDSMRSSADKLGVNTRSSVLTCRLENRTGLVSTGTTDGGYTVNDAVVVGLDQSLKAYGGMRQAATVIRTDTGAPIRWATIDDTANKGSIVGENTDSSATLLTFGSVELQSYKYTSGVWPVSVELLQDSQVNISGLIGEALGTRLARIHNEDFTLGDGTGEPLGVVVASTKGTDGSAATTVAYGDLVNLYHSVDPAYRSSPKCYWMMNDATLAKLKLMVSSADDRPLWQPGLVAGAPDTILGKPYIINNDMETAASGKKSILFGDFSKYLIRDVADIQVMVLRERWAEALSVGFIAFSRNDGVLLNTAAIKHILF